MRPIRIVACILALAGLSACTDVPTTRNAPVETPAPRVNDEVVIAPDWKVVDVRVNVPRDLLVSEANVYLPAADIVWTEDPAGDRYAQVAVILDDAITLGLSHLQGSREVYVDVELRRFHALTEKARAVTGGTHDIIFDYVVRDAKTGEDLTAPVRVHDEFVAYGGLAAMAAVRRGETQKWRITRYVANDMSQRFGGPEISMARRDRLAEAPHVSRFE